MSAKSAEELVVELCHWYSKMPKWPAGNDALVSEAGVVPKQMVCAAAIVPPVVGLAHGVYPNIKSPLPMPPLCCAMEISGSISIITSVNFIFFMIYIFVLLLF
jgi:hypothetical protein